MNEQNMEYKIPKVIHYCWFGGKELDKNSKSCIESWKKIMPEYKIIRWDESNYDCNKHPFLKEAYDNKKWAFVSDYARLDIIYNYGGIYLDTDVEVIKAFDDLLNNEVFMGFEIGNHVGTGLGFGAIKNNRFIKENLEEYNNLKLFDENGKMNMINCPIVTTNLLVNHGLELKDTNQIIDGISIYSSEYFCPMDFESGIMNITNNTHSIHRYNMTWINDEDKKNHLKKQEYIKKYGKKNGKIIYSFINIPYKIKVKLKNILK